MAEPIPVNALMRGLLVLEAVNAYGPAGLSEIQHHTGIPKATVLRLLESLRHLGYLTFDPRTRTYRVGLRALALGNNTSPDEHLLQVARPIMARLRERLGWPSDLAVFDQDKMVIIDTNRQPGILSSNRSIGSRVPMLASATGRAYLAAQPPAERERIIALLHDSTDPFERLARDPAAAQQLIEETVRRGYGLSDQEFLRTNRGAAVSVMADGRAVCVINLIAVASLATLADLEQRHVPMLLAAKAELEEQLRLSGPPRAAPSALPIDRSGRGGARR